MSKTRHGDGSVADTGTVLLSGFIKIKPDNRTVPVSATEPSPCLVKKGLRHSPQAYNYAPYSSDVSSAGSSTLKYLTFAVSSSAIF